MEVLHVFKRILVPLDGSHDSSKAVDMAGDIAEKFDAEVLLLRVVVPEGAAIAAMTAPESASSAQIAIEAAEEMVRQDKAAGRKYLAGLRKTLQDRGVKTSTVVEVGAAAKIIQQVAKQEKADLIVMMTRGNTGVKRVLLGSVADAVVRSAVAPVLVIRR